MKTLIHNYSSGITTEPMYFTRCLELCETPAHLWANEVSAFDMFDAAQPDVFISHYAMLTNDIVKYLSQNKKISTVLNVTGANDQELQTIEQVFLDNKMNIPFVFTNHHDSLCKSKTKKIKMVNIWPSVDIFLPRNPLPDFKINLAVLATEMSDLVKRAIASKDTYHLLSLSGDAEGFDLTVNVQSLGNMYDKYDEVMIASDVNTVFSQVLFEAALSAKKLSIRVNKQQQGTLDKVLASLFHDDGNKDVGSLVKQQIKRKHTCVNRAARLCRLLKNEDAAKRLGKLGEQLCEQ